MGAWIETYIGTEKDYQNAVAPHMGAWIETEMAAGTPSGKTGRTPYGCVD